MVKLTFLGTGCMVPTADRNQSGYFLRYKSEGILFDCGEGMQRQFKIAKEKPSKVTKILISHWHGDHVLGIPGFLEALSWANYNGVLEVYGPKGTRKKVEQLKDVFKSHIDLSMEVKDIKEGKFFENDDFYIEAYSLKHSVECLGYRFVEKSKLKFNMSKLKKLGLSEGKELGELQKGNKITFEGKTIKPEDVTFEVKGKVVSYIADTTVCNNTYNVAKDANILICESTYEDELEDKAEQYKHLTCTQAAEIAKESNVDKLYLTHFSQRFKDVRPLEKDAKKIFKNTICSKDFMVVELK